MTRLFNKNSWHYRLATVYGQKKDFEVPRNICGYIRSVLLGAFFVLVWIIIGVFVCMLLASPLIYWLVDGWYVMGVDNHPEIIVGTILYAGIGILLGWYYWDAKLSFIVHRRFCRNKPGFISSTFESIHNKTCFPIDFIDPKKARNKDEH